MHVILTTLHYTVYVTKAGPTEDREHGGAERSTGKTDNILLGASVRHRVGKASKGHGIQRLGGHFVIGLEEKLVERRLA